VPRDSDAGKRGTAPDLGAVRAWFDEHGWRLDPGLLRAALSERGASDEVIVELIDEGADRRRSAPVPAVRENHAVPARREEPRQAGPGNVPPQNREAEEHVLGSMMLAPGAIVACMEVLDPGDFYLESHAKIYRAAVDLYTDGEPVDAITLCDRLEQQGVLGEVGGRVRIHELAAIVPASANAGHYARIVREMALLREVIRVGGEIARMGWERADAADEIVGHAGQMVFDLARHGRGGSESGGEIAKRVFTRLRDLAEAGRDLIGTPTGFRLLDQLTSGLEPGNLVVIAGRPAMGKSALAGTIAAHVAFNEQLPVGLATLEMSRTEVATRLVSARSHVELSKFKRPGSFTGDEWARVASAANDLSNSSLFVNDRDHTLAGILADTRRVKTTHPDLALLVVDYLQLMDVDAENRTQEVSKVTRGLKQLALQLEIPVIALSQLNRNVEARGDKRPMLSDLRESGSIEQDADLVCFVYRDHYYNPTTSDPGVAELIVAKHRNGPTDTINLAWVPRYATFTDLHTPGILG